MLVIGDTAPSFTAPDQQGENHSLKDYRGNWLLLYFYPRDNTPGCTTEACTLRDNYTDLKKHLQVVGVSTDPVTSHAKFASKYNLPFTLLADPDKVIVKAYQVYGLKKFMGREFMGTNRISYLINPQGKIAKVYPKVKPAAHSKEVLADIKALS